MRRIGGEHDVVVAEGSLWLVGLLVFAFLWLCRGDWGWEGQREAESVKWSLGASERGGSLSGKRDGGCS